MKNPIWKPAEGAPSIFTLPTLEKEYGIRISPQDGAMICAFYSRSQESARAHAAKVAEIGSAKFMAGTYVGYAHKSIADCGSTTIFSERISMLAAKAIEDSPMFSGQETSTRYIDFDGAPIWEPTGHPIARETIEALMDFYRKLGDPLFEMVAAQHPIEEGQKLSVWETAIRARAFDIRRAFLPAGAATQVGWHGNLRQLADHLILLRHHPLEEVRGIANKIWGALREDFASSFPENAAMLDVSGERSLAQMPEAEEYRRLTAEWAWGDFAPGEGEVTEGLTVLRDSIDVGGLSDLAYRLLNERPRGLGLHHSFGEFGTATFQALVDFGSYRDLHRQRRGFWRMPVLTAELGFERWYLDNLPERFRSETELVFVPKLVERWREVAAKHGKVEAQHMVPMGFRVPWRYTCGLPQILYVAELRAAPTVHPTARRIAQAMARYVKEKWPWVALHADLGDKDFTVKRGTQTIRPA